jgi:lysozyme family protein
MLSMSARFDKMLPWLMQWEGEVFENDPDDPGGATKFGIDQRSHPKEDIRNLTKDRAKQIYLDEYWNKNKCEEMVFPVGEVVFNCCVNCGAGRARQLLAQSHNALEFIENQEAFYRRLVEQRPASKKYLKGWLARMESLKKFLKLG